MDNVVSKLIESIKRAYAKLAENGYDTGKEMITLSHDSIFALVNAIEEMEKQLEESQKSYESACDVAGDYYREIREIEAAAPKWISVEDELPPVGERVLACAGGRVVYEAFIDCDDSWFKAQNRSGFVFGITHWMPMPSTEGLNDT